MSTHTGDRSTTELYVAILLSDLLQCWKFDLCTQGTGSLTLEFITPLSKGEVNALAHTVQTPSLRSICMLQTSATTDMDHELASGVAY